MPKFNMSNVVTSRVLPTGYYDVTVVGIEETTTKKGGLLMFVAEMRVNKPEQFRGKKVTEYFVVGKNAWTVKSDTPEDLVEYFELNDPMAEEEITVQKRMGDLKTFAESACWERAQDAEWDTDDLVEEATGLKVGVRVLETADEDGEYKGRKKNKVDFFYRQGAHEAGADEVATKVKVGASSRAPKTRTRAVAEETD